MSDITHRTEYRKVAELKPLPGNPRTIKEDDLDRLKKSILENPDYFEARPLILSDRTGELIVLAGNQRLKAAKALGLEEVPTVLLSGLTAKKEQEIIIRDNVSNGDWDIEALKEWDTSDLEEWGVDTSWDNEPEQTASPDSYTREEADKLPSRVKVGQIWALGEHKLLCADCLDTKAIAELMDGEKAKCLFGMFPRIERSRNKLGEYTEKLTSDEYIDLHLSVIETWKKYLQGYLFWDLAYSRTRLTEFADIIYDCCRTSDLRCLEFIVWDKGNIPASFSKESLTKQQEGILALATEEVAEKELEMIALSSTEQSGWYNKKNKRKITNYWNIPAEAENLIKGKNNAVPVGLPSRAIELTTEEGDLVIDPFAGLGASLLAAEQLNRKCYACESDTRCCDIAIARWEKMTGEQAELLKSV